MRRIAVLIVVALTGLGTAADTQPAPVKSVLVAPKCVITGLNAAKTGVVTAAGRCLARTKSIPIQWTYNYTTFDQDGFACGNARSGNIRSFSLQPAAAYKANVRVSLSAKPRKGLKRVKPVVRIKTFILGGQIAECGKLGSVPLPKPEELCTEWPDGRDPFIHPCGQSNRWASFSSAATYDGAMVDFGDVASRSGSCVRTKGSIGTFPAPRQTTWLGYRIVGENLKCEGGIFAWLNVITIGLYWPSSGEFCLKAVFPYAWRFPIPPGWGGKLFVNVQMAVGYDWRTNEYKPVAGERITASFDLKGTENGCSQLMASG